MFCGSSFVLVEKLRALRINEAGADVPKPKAPVSRAGLYCEMGLHEDAHTQSSPGCFHAWAFFAASCREYKRRKGMCWPESADSRHHAWEKGQL